MKSILTLCLLTFVFAATHAQGESPKVIQWDLDRLDTIGGFPVSLVGNPVVVETDSGTAVEFDGVDDGLFIQSNPMAGATEFTIEVIFKPYPGGSVEQRFIHMEQDNDNRALIEMRLPDDNGWFLDTFIKSGSSSKALYAEDFLHTPNEWWHAGLVYKDGVMTHYVNGIEELTGPVDFQEVSSGKTSIGVRQNLVSWYKGAIKTLKVTHKALSPSEFIIGGSLPPDTIPTDTTTGPSVSSFNHTDVGGITSSLFPNPVTDVASLSYRVEKEAKVTVTIYNIQHIQVSELVNAVQSPGDYTATFQPENLPSGLYFYSIRSENHYVTNKFIIL